MNKILIISEGTKPDKQIIKHLLNSYKNKNIQYEIENYNTNIYMLYQNMKKEYEDIEDIEIIPILKKQKKDFKFNKEDFSEIYLFFDYDIHHTEFMKEKNCDSLNKQLEEMLKYFDNETGDRGKLYINYPMVESFFHIDLKNIKKFKDFQIELTEDFLELKKYKSTPIVCKLQGRFIQNNNFLDLNNLNTICIQHIMKENFIVNNEYNIPEYVGYSKINQKIIFNQQLIKYVNNKKISILSTFPRFIVDYFGENIFKKLQEYSSEVIF